MALLERVREISEAASIKLDLPPRALERYWRENINFDLDEDNLAGLQTTSTRLPRKV